jgi:hypothetical protein
MTTNSTLELQVEIERLVREHLAAQHRAVAAAVERAFAGAGARSKVASVRSPAGTRRAATEVSALAERLYEAVRARPGETMSVIAASVGQTPRALHRPMSHLKREGRVRSAGQRHGTRYFPMTPSGKGA